MISLVKRRLHMKEPPVRSEKSETNKPNRAAQLFVRLILLTLLLGLMHYLPAQDVSESVRNVSDQQLKKYVDQAQSQGYTQQQMESMAQARGLSHAEIASLRQRIKALSDASEGADGMSEGEVVLREEDVLAETETEFVNEKNRELSGQHVMRIFGTELFSSKDLSFTPSVNIPTPENYQLGPGDELVIDIWGASEQTYQLTISPEGYVKIPNLGPVFVSGMDIAYASRKLISRLTAIYSTLMDSGDHPQASHAQVSLGRIRSIKVNVVGEVKKPGTYTISSMSTVMHALYRAGGPSDMGSFREIRVFRNSRHIGTFDIYEFLLEGKHSQNIMLEEQDIIMIPNYTKRVSVTGQIKRPAIYELEGKENLADLLQYAGGLTDEGYDKLLTLKRKTLTSRKILTIKGGDFENFQLESGDEILVAGILDLFENRVTINGAVWRPGEYELTEGLTLRELLMKAEGVTEDAFWNRGLILRLNDDMTLRNIPFDVKKVLGDSSRDIALQPEDVVKIPSIFELRDQYMVSIRGEVRNPGLIQYEDSLTVEDLIVKSGGFKESAARSFVEVARKPDPNTSGSYDQVSEIFTFAIDDQLSVGSGASDFYLRPYDLVIVRKSPYAAERVMVEIEGEVMYPGNYAIGRKTERISDLFDRAGGVSSFAYMDGATLIRRADLPGSGIVNEEWRTVRGEILLAMGSGGSILELGDRNGYDLVNIDLPRILADPHCEEDLFLKAGDVLFVPRKLQTVHVNGEVFYPTTVRFEENRPFMHYVDMTGGFSEDAWSKKTYVVYSNGSASRTKRFLWFRKYPKVEPGAEIVVPKKPEKTRDMNVREAMGYLASILSLGILLSRI